MSEQLRLEKMLDMALLADFYGALLTEKQRQALRLFYEEDFSLGEIAETCDTSRQAAHDLIRRSEALLSDYEQKLGLAARYRQQKTLLETAEEQLTALGVKDKDFWEIWQEIKLATF